MKHVWKISQSRSANFVLFILIGTFGFCVTFVAVFPEFGAGEIHPAVSAIIGAGCDLLALYFLFHFFLPLIYLRVTPDGLHVLVYRLSRETRFIPWENVVGFSETRIMTGKHTRTIGTGTHRDRTSTTLKPAVEIEFDETVSLPTLRGGSYQVSERGCKFVACCVRMKVDEVIARLNEFRAM